VRHRGTRVCGWKKTIRRCCTNLKELLDGDQDRQPDGSVATLSRHLIPGTQVNCGAGRPEKLEATALMRDSRAQDMSFEIVDMTLEERSKYRRMLAGKPLQRLQQSAPPKAK